MDPVALIQTVGMGPIEHAVAHMLALRFGKWTSTEQLIYAAWNGDEAGGPDNPEACLRSIVHNLRRKLAPVGLVIQGVPYYGRRMMRA